MGDSAAEPSAAAAAEQPTDSAMNFKLKEFKSGHNDFLEEIQERHVDGKWNVTNLVDAPKEFFEDDDYMAWNTPMGRYYQKVACWRNLNGAEFAEVFQYYTAMWLPDDFAIVDINDKPLLFKTTNQVINGAKQLHLVTCERAPTRKVFFSRSVRTLEQMGFDRLKHAIQVYPLRVVPTDTTAEARRQLQKSLNVGSKRYNPEQDKDGGELLPAGPVTANTNTGKAHDVIIHNGRTVLKKSLKLFQKK